MMYLGFLLLAGAVAAVVIGVLQRSKMKTIIAAPFKPTGHALASADNKGLVSFQGTVQPAQQLIAPCSGQPCLYFEIQVHQEWEKYVQTENGNKTEKGSDSAQHAKHGSMFYVNDGSGYVPVNATESVDAKLETSFEEKKSYGWGDLSFGGYRTHVHPPSDGKHATGTRCVEKIIPAHGELFVLGKVNNNVVSKRDGVLGSIMLAREGRDSLLGATKRNMAIAFAAAGMLVPTGGAMAIFGDAPEAAADGCVAMEDGLEDPCLGRVHDEDDVSYTWTVTEEADYAFSAIGTGTDPSMRLWPEIKIKQGADAVFSLQATSGDAVKGSHHFEPGTYTIVVNDAHSGWAENLKGGAGFKLEIAQSESTKSAAEPEKKSAVREFFDGPVPAGVELTKSYTAYSPKYTMTIPANWRTGGNRASSYMAMRADSTAAVFCDWGGLSMRKIQTLAKRAPAAGKDVEIAEGAEVFTMGTEEKFTVRAGQGSGRFFKAEGGQLYWMDVAYKDGSNRSPGVVHCVMMVKAGADEAVVNEAKGIMRAFQPPRGKPVIDDRQAVLRDDSKKKKM